MSYLLLVELMCRRSIIYDNETIYNEPMIYCRLQLSVKFNYLTKLNRVSKFIVCKLNDASNSDISVIEWKRQEMRYDDNGDVEDIFLKVKFNICRKFESNLSST